MCIERPRESCSLHFTECHILFRRRYEFDVCLTCFMLVLMFVVCCCCVAIARPTNSMYVQYTQSHNISVAYICFTLFIQRVYVLCWLFIRNMDHFSTFSQRTIFMSSCMTSMNEFPFYANCRWNRKKINRSAIISHKNFWLKLEYSMQKSLSKEWNIHE